MKKGKKSHLSLTFITTTTIIFAVLILAIALAFNYFMRNNSSLLNDVITILNHDHLLEKADLVIDRLTLHEATDKDSVSSILKKYCTRDRGFLYVILYQKTADDNYFKIIDTIPVSKSLALDLKKKSVVREIKDKNYLQEGLLHSTVEPRRYSQQGIYWQNVYVPFQPGRKKLILQFLISVEKSNEAVSSFNKNYNTVRLMFSILSGALILIILVLSLVFSHNVSLLITNLSLFMDKAASGELDINLNPSDDAGLNQLALSFNSLIEELKDKTDKTKADPLAEIFREGVDRLKEKRPDDAIAIFHTLAIFRPTSFGNFFNLAIAYAMKKQYRLSLEMFRQARELNPAYDLTDRYIEKVEKLLAAHDGT